MTESKPSGARSVYTFAALDESAKEKAREWYRQGNDMPFLSEQLTESVRAKLEEQGFTVGDGLRVFYSLSYSQGDGLSFSGTIERDGETYKVTQSGHYQHEMTMDCVRVAEDGNEYECTPVLERCRKIARAVAEEGYKEIEYQNSPAVIDEALEANGYTFTSEGVRLDADKA